MRDKLVKKYLTKEIRTFNPEIDDKDLPLNKGIFTLLRKVQEFSQDNQKYLLNEILKIKSKTNVIVEIGVSRLYNKHYDQIQEIENTTRTTFDKSSTSVILRSKNDSTKYLGIDIEDKKFLESLKPNIYTLQARSEDFEVVSNKFKEVGIEQIDFLFIDGWHSINQVIDELWYLQFMKPGGVIGFHDVNHHPGPKAILESLNPDIFEIINYNTPDWGIGFAKIK